MDEFDSDLGSVTEEEPDNLEEIPERPVWESKAETKEESKQETNARAGNHHRAPVPVPRPTYLNEPFTNWELELSGDLDIFSQERALKAGSLFQVQPGPRRAAPSAAGRGRG